MARIVDLEKLTELTEVNSQLQTLDGNPVEIERVWGPYIERIWPGRYRADVVASAMWKNDVPEDADAYRVARGHMTGNNIFNQRIHAPVMFYKLRKE